jgi:hypothetical protein
MNRKTALLLACVAVAASAVAPAFGAMYTWNTTGAINPGSGTACAGGQACKATFTSTSGSQTLIAKAYSTPVNDTSAPFNIDGKWLEARIAAYSGGIGVANTVVGDVTSESGVPEHAVDNQAVKDVVVFELPAGAWDPEFFKLGWLQTDSDVQAWVGGSSLASNYDFRNACFSGTGCSTLASLGFTEITSTITGNGNDVPLNTATNFNTASSGRYLIMTGALGVNNVSADNDFFKISAISATKLPPGVPAPSALLLLGLGLGLMRPWRARTTHV